MKRYIPIAVLWISCLAAQQQQLPELDREYERNEAYWILNQRREAAGLNRLSKNDALQTAAQRHAAYAVRHRTSSHYEEETQAGYSGRTPFERAVAAGYPSRLVSENLSTNNVNAEASVDGLFSAIYHRFGFLDPSIDEVGIGVAQAKGINTFVYDMGNGNIAHLCQRPSLRISGAYVYDVCADANKRLPMEAFKKARTLNARYNPPYILYPYAGQEEVPPVFYHESPDPLPDYEVSGFPVSILFNAYHIKHPKLLSFELYNAQGKRIACRVMDKAGDPNGRFTQYQYALFPLQRLEYDTTYEAKAVFETDGKRKNITWKFHTRKPEEPLFRIDRDKTEIALKHVRSFWLYIVPRHGHDLLKNVVHDSALYVRFLDHNTLRVVLPKRPKRRYTIEADGRKIVIYP